MGVARILLVEDEALCAEGFAKELRNHAEVVIAYTAAEARELLTRGGPWGGCVVDVLLPDGSGFDVVGLARRLFPYALVMVATGAAEIAHINRTHALNAALVEKPVPIGWMREFARKTADLVTLGRPSMSAVAPPHVPGESRSEALRPAVERLRALFAGEHDWRRRYAIGTIVADLMGRPGIVGSGAVVAVASALGQGTATLYRHAAVAKRWSLTELETLFTQRGTRGFLLSWSLVSLLATIESERLHRKFLKRTFTERLSVRELAVVLAKAGLPR